jgi:hypothetical protein
LGLAKSIKRKRRILAAFSTLFEGYKVFGKHNPIIIFCFLRSGLFLHPQTINRSKHLPWEQGSA